MNIDVHICEYRILIFMGMLYTYNTCKYVCVQCVCDCIMKPFTGWRRCIGCLKLQVSFRKRAIIHRALLRKMTYKDKASYASLPPCMSSSSTVRLYTHMYVCDEDPLCPPFLQCVNTYIHIYIYVIRMYTCIYSAYAYVYVQCIA